jgi:hypothetical protein
MRNKEETKVVISEIILAIILLLSLLTEYFDGKVNEQRYQIINREQLATNFAVNTIEYSLGSFQSTFNRAFHLPLIATKIDDKENIDPVELSLSDDFNAQKISSDQFSEKLADRSAELARQTVKTYGRVINSITQLQNNGRAYEKLLNILNFLKFVLVLLVMFLQFSLFVSLQKRTRPREGAVLQ